MHKFNEHRFEIKKVQNGIVVCEQISVDHYGYICFIKRYFSKKMSTKVGRRESITVIYVNACVLHWIFFILN